jgi:ribosomal protein S19E (S16A)
MKETKTVQSVDGDQKLYSGRTLTSAGQKMMDEVAHSIRAQVEEAYPGLEKY